MGGFDTHSATVTNQTNLFNQLAPAMKAFYDYTVADGVDSMVTQFTSSDFNRTFIGNGNAGVDHAWGGHHLVLGGAVEGRQHVRHVPEPYGQGTRRFRQQRRVDPDDYRRPGRRHAREMVRHAGRDIAQVFPNLKNFAPDLGFMG